MHKHEWKRISCKQSARWQHLSQLKTSAFFSLEKKLDAKKCNNTYLGLVRPSGGWWSPIVDINNQRHNTQHNDIQHNDTGWFTTLSICNSRHKRHSITTLYHYVEFRVLFVVMLSVIMLRLCRVSLCWVSLCWVSLCWVSLCWVSWSPIVYLICFTMNVFISLVLSK